MTSPIWSEVDVTPILARSLVLIVLEEGFASAWRSVLSVTEHLSPFSTEQAHALANAIVVHGEAMASELEGSEEWREAASDLAAFVRGVFGVAPGEVGYGRSLADLSLRWPGGVP